MRFAPILLAASCLLAACAGPDTLPMRAESLLADRLFAPPSEPVRTDDLFAMSDAMRRYLAVDIADQLRRDGPQAGLMEALQTRAQLKLEYDAARTKNAAATFAARTGNCLSLVIMTAAFAKELRLPISYRSAYLDESWSRTGNLLISSGHVNVTVGRRILDAKTQRDLSPMTIDFLPPEEISGLRTRDIDESTVLAMYANNRAAEALADGQLDDAYAWAAESLRAIRRSPAPTTRSASSTCATATSPRRRAPSSACSRASRRTRACSPTWPRPTAGKGAPPRRRRRASAWRRSSRIRRSTSSTSAWRRCSHEDYRAAREMFAREVARADSYHEFHFWLGVADWRLGDEAAAQRHLSLAIDNSLTRSQHDLYAAKLDWLQAHRVH